MPDLAYWGWLAARLAAEAGVIVAVAAGIAIRWKHGPGRRWLWLAALLGVGLVWAGEVSGLADLAGVRREIVHASDRRVVQVEVLSDPEELKPEPTEPAVPGRADAPPVVVPVWWPGWVWLGGTLGLSAWSAMMRWWLGWRDRRGGRARGETAEMVRRLARLLGVGRIEARAWPGWRGPMAFGLWRPRIVVPADFEARFDGRQREAMLAHELAHVASRDAWWMTLAGGLCAVAWWFPGVWWLRRRLRMDLERDADAASALTSGGPTALAEALVTLGRDWVSPASVRGLAVDGSGLRSELGRRVASLLATAPTWRRSTGREGRVATVISAVVALVVLGMAGGPAGSAALGPLVLAQVRVAKREDSATAGRPGPAAVGLTTVSNAVDRERAGKLIRDGDLFLEAGAADRAALRFEEALTTDPGNLEARERLARAKGMLSRQVAGDLGPQDPPEAGRTREKLERIVLPEVFFEGTPLREVVRWLQRESQAHDSGGEGIWFGLASRVEVDPPADRAQDTAEAGGGGRSVTNEGAVIASRAVGYVTRTLDHVMVRMPAPRENARLKDILDEVIKAASEPIAYEVSGHGSGIHFVPAVTKAAPPPRLLTRVFRIDGARMVERVAKELGRSETPPIGVDLPDRGPVQEMIREYFGKLGVSLLPPNAMFLNDRLGLLMVRVTEAEIGRIEEALERMDVGRREADAASDSKESAAEGASPGGAESTSTLALRASPVPTGSGAVPPGPDSREGAGAPTPATPSVRLEVKVLEVPEKTGEDVGLDWLFADAAARETPPKWEEPTGDLPGAQSAGVQNIRVERGRLEARSVVLTEAQVSALLKRLESRGGIELVSPPPVEARSGSLAQVQVHELRRIVTGVEARDAVGTNAAQVTYQTEEMAFGPTVQVRPTFEDGAWRLTVTGRQTDFIGYDDPGKSVVQGPDPKAEPLSYQLPLPLLRVREVLGDGRLEAGETLMLRGPVAETIVRTRRGWFRPSKLETERRRCYVLLTPSSAP